MPFTMNGIGTHVCTARGDIGWGSCDAMECLVVFFMPIVPYKAMHTFDWQGEQYRAIPIRWSLGLVVRTYLKPWSWCAIVISAVLLFIAIIEASQRRNLNVILLGAGAALACLGALGLTLFYTTDRRNKAIRRVIGGMAPVGTCDPVNLKQDLLEQMNRNTKVMYGTDSFAAAVEPQLGQGAFANAMWAARMTVALEDRTEGERLTDLVLNHPEVKAAIEQVRKKPEAWVKVMLSDEERQAAMQAQQPDVSAGGARSRVLKSGDEEFASGEKGKLRRHDDEDY